MHRSLALLPVLTVFASAWAFNPPVDKAGPITLRILDVPPITRLNVPISVGTTLTNSSASVVTGTLVLSVIDEWRVVTPPKRQFRLGPGAELTLWHRIVPGTGTHAALYPIHARATFGSPPVTAHAVAIVKVPEQAVPPRMLPESGTWPPVLGLTSGRQLPLEDISRASLWYRVGAERPVALPRTFPGWDLNTGVGLTRRDVARGDTRPAVVVHPPWRTGWGTVWFDYRVSLPRVKPIRLIFANAIRDHNPDEPPSDGVQFKVYVSAQPGRFEQVFDRFTASKVWQDAEVDLSRFAGRTITLRFWAGPGPRNDTTCDEGYWGRPTLSAGSQPSPESPTAWAKRQQLALSRAQAALRGRPGPYSWVLRGVGETCAAGLVPGPNGLTDAAIAFAAPKGTLVLRGFSIEVDRSPIGTPRCMFQIVSKSQGWSRGHAILRYTLMSGSHRVPVQADLYAQGGALRAAFSMPGVSRNVRGHPRFTMLSVGPGNRKALRVYAGFGNVVQDPEAFDLWAGGFTLSTRHVGADYEGGLSLVQATDIFPDVFRVRPQERTYALATHHDATISLIPSAKGAFFAARTYREHVARFRPAHGVHVLAGKMCLDQWAGDYIRAAEDIRRAASYGIRDAVFVKHDWQCWGYDYRLPDIFPPHDGLDRFLHMVRACKQAGILFVPHDNYIDFYPDATGYSYNHILFNEDGTPQLAWYNEWRQAQSYRWSPLAFKPFLIRNRDLLRRYVAPGGIFVDVFSAIPPMDFYDRAGRFYPKTVTLAKWGECFDLFRAAFGPRSVTISEAGCDGLIGHLDGGQSDHGSAFGLFAGWGVKGGDAERVPWHDMATHGSFILFAGGLGDRYRSGLPADKHGYASDDYLTTTVMGGRNPMCDGPFNRGAVMTYWLLHDICARLARLAILKHEFFGGDIHRQIVRFGSDSVVYANRGSTDWLVQGKTLPPFGFLAVSGKVRAEITRRDGTITAYSESPSGLFVDARPPVSPRTGRGPLQPQRVWVEDLGDGRFRLGIEWLVVGTIPDSYQPYLHFISPSAPLEGIVFYGAPRVPDNWRSPGRRTWLADVELPPDVLNGDFGIRFGLFDPSTGTRMVPRGPVDRGGRSIGGVLVVRNRRCSYAEEAQPLDPRINTARAVVSFGTVATNGAFRLSGDGDEQILMPLPDSDDFTVELRMHRGRSTLSVVCITPAGKDGAQLPVTVSSGTAKFIVPADTFACRLKWR